MNITSLLHIKEEQNKTSFTKMHTQTHTKNREVQIQGSNNNSTKLTPCSPPTFGYVSRNIAKPEK